jgi:SAM-dependent methyltransferase
MDIREQMDRIYREMPLDDIPWNISEPPDLLVRAVENGTISPCSAVDLGCGAGNYSVWLAEQGFDVTGIDISTEAVALAARNAEAANVSCTFVTADLLGDLTPYLQKFGFALDWEVLHHVFPEDREHYIENVHRLLRPGGTYLSICFSIKDAAFGGRGSYRDTPLGTRLYFSSEEELRALFGSLFTITGLSTVEVPGKYTPHQVNVAWLRR